MTETSSQLKTESPFAGVRGRGSVDYLFRNTQQAIVALTGQADVKASILITACSVSITLALTGHRGIWSGALYVLAAFAAVALILAILVVVPKHRARPPAISPGEDPTFNLLFFGHFRSLSQDEFVDAIGAVCQTDETVYEAVARDIYAMGTYLQHSKYRYLRWSYGVLVVGVVAALLTDVAHALIT